MELTDQERAAMQDKKWLRTFKHPIGARCAQGRTYITLKDAGRLGAAIEKRARKALKRGGGP